MGLNESWNRNAEAQFETISSTGIDPAATQIQLPRASKIGLSSETIG